MIESLYRQITKGNITIYDVDDIINSYLFETIEILIAEKIEIKEYINCTKNLRKFFCLH